MWTTKRLYICLLACFLWLPAAGSTSQAEEMYQISETELTQLETNLQTLKAHSKERQKVLTEQATLLDQQREELKKLKEEISSSKAANEETKKSLENANQSLVELEKEAARKVQVKARQRNLWIGATALMMYAYIKGK